jgi:SAM-dependent methyltransferase
MKKASIEYFGKDLEAMSFAQNYHQWILEICSPYLGKVVAEIGAGTGNFSDFLLSSDIKRLVAFEPSDNMYPLLEEKFKTVSNVETIKSLFENRSETYTDAFDSVCYINVLEHIEKDDEALFHAYKCIRKNGYLLIFVPALNFLFSEMDKSLGHYRRYSKKNLYKVVSSAGFSVKTIKYFDLAGIVPWYIAFVLMKGTMKSSGVAIYDRLVVPFMKKVERILPPPIGKNLVLVARKE